jgi:hypothetical protein
VLLLLAGCSAPPPPPPAPVIASAEQLVRAMHARYSGTWYRTLTFVQRNTRHLPNGGTESSTWLEAVALPGRLRIDIEPRSAGSGTLFVNDTQYVIRNGTVAHSAAGVHPLLLLGWDVYFIPPERTLAGLRSLGFDLTRMHEGEWQGRPVYVVGAAAGDGKARQFWIDRERLVFVRMLQPAPQDTSKLSDIRFEGYRPLAGGWIAPEVIFLLGDQPTFVERYEDVRADVPLDLTLFDPKRWTTARHWYGGS